MMKVSDDAKYRLTGKKKKKTTVNTALNYRAGQLCIQEYGDTTHGTWFMIKFIAVLQARQYIGLFQI